MLWFVNEEQGEGTSLVPFVSAEKREVEEGNRSSLSPTFVCMSSYWVWRSHLGNMNWVKERKCVCTVYVCVSEGEEDLNLKWLNAILLYPNTNLVLILPPSKSLFLITSKTNPSIFIQSNKKIKIKHITSNDKNN